MCTVSWLHEEDGYQLFCNRDEKRSRQRAEAPRLLTRHGVQFVAPIDADFGGTWIATNEFGISLCLLNGANITGVSERIAVRPFQTSRGLLLLEWIAASSALDLWKRFGAADLSCFAPFTLVAIEPCQPAGICEWNGTEKVILPYGEPYLPLTSSSFDSAGVCTSRLAEYDRLVRTGARNPNALKSFHASHDDGPGAYSTCMHRPDAETVSFSWINVTDSDATFYYTPAAPCQHLPGEVSTLRLRR
jgi:hypothetical protein